MRKGHGNGSQTPGLRRGLPVAIGIAALLGAAGLTGCNFELGDVSVGSSAQPTNGNQIAADEAAAVAGDSQEARPKRTGPPRTLTVLGSGDILIHPSLADQADSNGGASDPDFTPMLAGVAGRVKGSDLSICHAETPFSEPGVRTQFPHYYVHPNLAKGIAATGFDECSTASNWAADKGLSGVKRTVAALTAAGVGQAGMQTSPNESRIKIKNVKGIRVAHLSYTDPHDSPSIDGADWAVNRQGPAQIAEDAKTARQQGAEVVIVSLAMGEMGSDSTSAQQNEAADIITRGGDVDLVIGHGSHTVQPAKRINNTWVIWHGNLMSSFFPDQTNMLVGLVSQTTLSEQADGRFAATKVIGYPVHTQKGSERVVDLALQKCSTSEYQDSWEAVRDLEASATATGFSLARTCQGR